jgi:hypothetical protein
MAIEIVTQQGQRAGREAASTLLARNLHEQLPRSTGRREREILANWALAFSRAQLAVLSLTAVLRAHECGFQGNHAVLAGVTVNGATNAWE